AAATAAAGPVARQALHLPVVEPAHPRLPRRRRDAHLERARRLAAPRARRDRAERRLLRRRARLRALCSRHSAAGIDYGRREPMPRYLRFILTLIAVAPAIAVAQTPPVIEG